MYVHRIILFCYELIYKIESDIGFYWFINTLLALTNYNLLSKYDEYQYRFYLLIKILPFSLSRKL